MIRHNSEILRAGFLLGGLLRLGALLLCSMPSLPRHILGLVSLGAGEALGGLGSIVGVGARLAVFLGCIVGAFVLLLTKKFADRGKDVAGDDQGGGDHSLASGYVAIPTAALVLAAVDVKDVVLAVADGAEGEVGVVKERAFDLLGVFLHDGEAGVDFGETVGGEGVRFVDVRCDVAVGTLGVWDEGRNESLIAGVGEGDGFFAVGVGLEGRNGVGDCRVGGEVLLSKTLAEGSVRKQIEGIWQVGYVIVMGYGGSE